MSIYTTYYKNGYKAIDRDNYYKLYLEDTIKLARTLIVKSEYTAIKQNEFLALANPGSFDPSDKTTWKYYRNLAGLSYPGDPVLEIISLDTLTPVPFDKDVLQYHPSTRAAYEFGSRYYKELVLRYPEHEDIILGALYPVDINEAIEAKDFTILNYPKELVEENEISLIQNIQNWLYNFDVRWNNKQFTLSDSLYGASCYGVMSMLLLPLILNLRLRACHTFEAHSFHVRQYLASHGGLDRFLPYMTLKQALFFYRNIAYIERNNGKREIFSWLTEKILTDRQIPLSEYKMHHSDAIMPSSYTPAVYFNKDPLNEYASDAKSLGAKYSVRKVLDKEQPLAPDNERYSSSNLNRIEKLFERSLSNVLNTKVLESSMIDYSDAVPHTLHQVFLNQWVHFINTNRFNNRYITIKDPGNGADVQIRTDVAFYYYLYAYTRSLGYTPKELIEIYKGWWAQPFKREIELALNKVKDLTELYKQGSITKNILDDARIELIKAKEENTPKIEQIENAVIPELPILYVYRVRREPIPTVDDLLEVVDPKYFPGDTGAAEHAQYILDYMNPIGDAYTVQGFRDTCTDIYLSLYKQLHFVYKKEPITERAMTYSMVNRCYMDTVYGSIDPNSSYEDWLHAKDLRTDYTNTDEWETIYKSIYQEITGLEINSVSETGRLQEAMIKLFQQLASYSVHFVYDINSQAIRNPAFNTVRVEGEGNGRGRIYEQILLGIWKIFKRRIRPKDYDFIELPYLFINSFITNNKTDDNEFIQIPIDIFPSGGRGSTSDVIDLGILRVNQESLPLPDESTLEDNPNYSAYFSMTDEERASILNVYCNCPEPYYEPTTVDINDIMPVTDIPAFDYTKPLWQHMNMFNYQYIPYSTVYFNVDSNHIDLNCFYLNIGDYNFPHFVLHTGIVKVDPVDTTNPLNP